MEKQELSTARPSLLRAWWPALVWVGIIAVESTDLLSSEHTGSLLYKLITKLFGPINLASFLQFHFYLRKTGHVAAYGLLSLLLLRGWRMTLDPAKAWLGRIVTLAWLGTVLVASMDEWHQSYIPSRTGTWHDVVLDSTAGLIFLSVAWLWMRRSERTSALTSSQLE
jgi:VanZ family protein